MMTMLAYLSLEIILSETKPEIEIISKGLTPLLYLQGKGPPFGILIVSGTSNFHFFEALTNQHLSDYFFSVTFYIVRVG